MSARTPIPRTVAMTVFGDMDTSVLTQLPPGRSPITSHVVANERWYDRAWGRVAEEVAAGHQAYVVCPRITGDHFANNDTTNAPATAVGMIHSVGFQPRSVGRSVPMLCRSVT